MDQCMILTTDTQFKRRLREGVQRRVFRAGTVVLTHGETDDGVVNISYSVWKATVPSSWLRTVS